MEPPRIYLTDEWGAKAATQTFSQHAAKGIVVHNMENLNRPPLQGDEEVRTAFSLARQNQHDHMADRGWSDTGQHFTISRGGVILEGRHGSAEAARRGMVVRGAHAGVNEQNTYWYGIELEGDNRHSYVVTGQQWGALTDLCAWLCVWGRIDARLIEPHNHFHDTSCPGHVAEHIQELRDAVARRKDEIDGGGNGENEVRNEPGAGSAPRVNFKGKMSTFGGPHDTGVSPSEGLALVDQQHFEELREYFLDVQPPGTTGLARRLNPEKFYIACRWDYDATPQAVLRASLVNVRNPQNGKSAQAKPVDWGPNESTGRVADLSPGLARFLGLETDNVVEVTMA